MIAHANPPVPFDYRTICTLQAALEMWDERFLPEDRKQPMDSMMFLAQGGAILGVQFPELDAEEVHKLKNHLILWSRQAAIAEGLLREGEPL
jgi:hypothetical protein